MPKLYWEYRPEWAAWWLMISTDGTTDQKGYGPFQNDFEVRMASEVHNVQPPMGLCVA